MYNKKNKLSQPVSILDDISIQLSNAVNVMLMKSAPFFFRNIIFDGRFKNKLNVPFCDDFGRWKEKLKLAEWKNTFCVDNLFMTNFVFIFWKRYIIS